MSIDQLAVAVVEIGGEAGLASGLLAKGGNVEFFNDRPEPIRICRGEMLPPECPQIDSIGSYTFTNIEQNTQFTILDKDDDLIGEVRVEVKSEGGRAAYVFDILPDRIRINLGYSGTKFKKLQVDNQTSKPVTIGFKVDGVPNSWKLQPIHQGGDKLWIPLDHSIVNLTLLESVPLTTEPFRPLEVGGTAPIEIILEPN